MWSMGDQFQTTCLTSCAIIVAQEYDGMVLVRQHLLFSHRQHKPLQKSCHICHANRAYLKVRTMSTRHPPSRASWINPESNSKCSYRACGDGHRPYFYATQETLRYLSAMFPSRRKLHPSAYHLGSQQLLCRLPPSRMAQHLVTYR